MIQSIRTVYILSFIFLFLFFIREYVAYKRYLVLKYLFTPSLTLVLVIIMTLSISINGCDRYRIMILVSLLMALVADSLLMIEEVNLLKNGMIFFILGHICYAVAFSNTFSFKMWNLIPVLIIIFLSIRYLKVLFKYSGKMFIPVLAYVLILDLMVYLAIIRLNNGLSASGVAVAAGAVLFMVSDFLLSVNAFVKTIPNSTVFTWLLYAPAQFLFVLSTFMHGNI